MVPICRARRYSLNSYLTVEDCQERIEVRLDLVNGWEKLVKRLKYAKYDSGSYVSEIKEYF